MQDPNDTLVGLSELDSLMMQADLANKEAREASARTHTPGPWRATGPNVRADTDDGDGALIAVVRDKHFFDGEPLSLSELRANARLMAASPTLLMALFHVFEDLETYRDYLDGLGLDDSPDPREIMEEIRSAILDATGGE